MEKINKLSLPASILIGVVVLGGFYYATESSKQKSIERRQEAKLVDEKRIEGIKEEQSIKEQAIEDIKDQAATNQKLSEKAQLESMRLSCILSAKSMLNTESVINDAYGIRCDTDFASVKQDCLNNYNELLTSSLNKYKDQEKTCWARYPLK